jgi:hypothetical protein
MAAKLFVCWRLLFMLCLRRNSDSNGPLVSLAVANRCREQVRRQRWVANGASLRRRTTLQLAAQSICSGARRPIYGAVATVVIVAVAASGVSLTRNLPTGRATYAPGLVPGHIVMHGTKAVQATDLPRVAVSGLALRTSMVCNYTGSIGGVPHVTLRGRYRPTGGGFVKCHAKNGQEQEYASFRKFR